MKIRTGFVSNSSSSSFIVATKGNASLKAELRIEVDLRPMIHNSITTLKELEEYIIDDYGYQGGTLKDILQDDYVQEIYDKCRPLIEKGFTVHLGSASDEEGGAEEFICNEGLKGNLMENENAIVVHSEAGY